MSTQQSIARTIVDADTCSFKRLAWAFGCAPKGSSEEAQLEMLLLKRAAPELNELCATWSSVAIGFAVENNALNARIAELHGDPDASER